MICLGPRGCFSSPRALGQSLHPLNERGTLPHHHHASTTQIYVLGQMDKKDAQGRTQET